MTEGNKSRKWISDIIGDQYKEWKNEYIALDAGTGCGKSYFCINVLGDYAQKFGDRILYLTNRSALRNQIYDEVQKKNLGDTIHVTLYQTLQRDLNKGYLSQYDNYDYIVADECHYFITDAMFNHYTDIAYDFIMGQTKKVVILVSATAKLLFEELQLQKKLKHRNIFRIDKDYSYVKKLYYYQKDELKSIIDFILHNEEDSKILVFCNSAQRMIEMNAIYEEQADYYCSKGVYTKKKEKSNQKEKSKKKKTSKEFVQLRKICGWFDEDGNLKKKNSVIHEYADGMITFNKRILFTTKVLDNGINLRDRKIKHIFSEILDLDTLIQSFGRKRSIDADDTCTFYIREYQKKGIQGLINKVEKPLEQAKMYAENYEKFQQQYGKNRYWMKKNEIFYTNFSEDKEKGGTIKTNYCKYMKFQIAHNMYCSMKKLGHKNYLFMKLPLELNAISSDIKIKSESIDYFLLFLKKIEGKRLYAEDRECIKEEFEKIGLKMRYKGIATFNNTLNGALQDKYGKGYNCRFYNSDESGKEYRDYRRVLESGTQNTHYKKNYWILR